MQIGISLATPEVGIVKDHFILGDLEGLVDGADGAVPVALIMTGMAVALAPQPAEAELVGLVKRVVSDAYGTPPKLKREEKHPRFPVVQDELLETGKDSAMLVEFLDKTLLTLGSESHLTIDTMVYDPKSQDGRMVLNLAVGVLRFISGKMVAAGVTIVTPSVILGIRGSDALIIVAPDGSTTVNVYSGEFSVSNSDGSEQAAVGPAQSVSVSAVGAVGAVGPGPTSAPGSPAEGSSPGDPGGGDEGGWPANPSAPSGPGPGPGPGAGLGGGSPGGEGGGEGEGGGGGGHPDDHGDGGDGH